MSGVPAVFWARRRKPGGSEAFANCSTPSERAKQDPVRFLEFYFLTDGTSDRTKTAEPLALDGLDSPSRAELHELAGDIGGLHTKSGGADKNRILFIGWGHSAVWDLARDLEKQEERRQAAEREAVWEVMMKGHYDFVSELGQKSPRPFELQNCKGSYIVRCSEITTGYSEGPKLTLDISSGADGSLQAAYELGVIEGTMLLDPSEERVAALAIELDSDSDEDVDEEEEPEEDNDEEERQPTAARKRAAPVPAGPAAKKQRTLPPNHRRLFFRMRGRETGEGEIFYDPEPGHIDFTDDDCTHFVGLMYDNFLLDKNTEFEGFKVSSKPRMGAEEWSCFSEGSHEYARVARWR
ncbi:uncharacterized protein BKA78DRAFT_296862 [Phyllosticta capitalensis]|uniref:uncharacterized protein n=1 Tax=Phyllosticta capitalensis TaxID=121624 RepID=UPI00312ED491